jgi:hypothetical protein
MNGFGMLAPCTCPICGGSLKAINIGRSTGREAAAILLCECGLEWCMTVMLTMVEASARRATPRRREQLQRARVSHSKREIPVPA